MTNRERFVNALTEVYRDLFQNDPNFSYSRDSITPEDLAEKMTASVLDRDCIIGVGIKRTCKELGIRPCTYSAIKAWIEAA